MTEQMYNPMNKEFQDECKKLGLTGYQLRHKYEIQNEKMKKVYDDWGGDETEIYNQVIKYSKEIGCYDKLKLFIDKNPGSLNGECHWFKNTIEVNQWFETHLDFIIS